MKKKWIVIAAATVMLAGATAFGVRYVASQTVEDYAVKVNGTRITEAQVADAVRARQRVAEVLKIAGSTGAATPAAGETDPAREFARPPSTDRGVVVQQLIEDELMVQEARRRGFTCSQEEATEQTRRMSAIGGPQDLQVIASAAVASGMADPSYLLTPEAARTPSTRDLNATYVADPKVVGVMVRSCQISKLYSTLGDSSPTGAVPFGGGANDTRTQAIEQLRADLLSQATIERKPGY